MKLPRKSAPRVFGFSLIAVLFLNANVPVCGKQGAQNADEQAVSKELKQSLKSDSWDRIISACTAYLNKHPNDAHMRAMRGYALMEANRDAQSLADLDAAIKAGLTELPVDLVEDNANSLLSVRGFALMRVGRLKEGIADIEKAVKSRKRLVIQYFNDKADYQNLCAAYSRLGNGAKAAQYRKASEESDRMLQSILQPHIASDADAKAMVAKLKAECKASPDSSIPLTKLALCQVYLKAWTDALKSVDSALVIEPYMSRTRVMRLEILKSLQKEAEAKKETASILQYFARTSGSAENAGERMLVTSRMIEIFKKFNDVDGQIAVLESLASRGTAGESQLYDLGQCFAKRNQWAKAVDAYTDALDYATDNQPLILDARAKARKMLGQAKEAEKDTAESARLRNRRTKI